MPPQRRLKAKSNPQSQPRLARAAAVIVWAIGILPISIISVSGRRERSYGTTRRASSESAVSTSIRRDSSIPHKARRPNRRSFHRYIRAKAAWSYAVSDRFSAFRRTIRVHLEPAVRIPPAVGSRKNCGSGFRAGPTRNAAVHGRECGVVRPRSNGVEGPTRSPVYGCVRPREIAKERMRPKLAHLQTAA